MTTVRAPRIILDRFLAHHLSLGADRIFIYFDDADWAWTYDDPRLVTTVCDETYWDARRGQVPDGAPVRPPDIALRQIYNGAQAKRRTASEWLLHIDVDELLVCEGTVRDTLEHVPSSFDNVHVNNVEAVYRREPTRETVFDTEFFRQQLRPRLGQPAWQVWVAMGRLAPLTNRGLLGHISGKSFYRVASDVAVSIHGGRRTKDSPANFKPPNMQVLHFDCLAYEEFRQKHMRRVEGISPADNLGPQREKQMDLIARTYRSRGDRGLRALYRRLNVFGPVRLWLAMRVGYVVRLDWMTQR